MNANHQWSQATPVRRLNLSTHEADFVSLRDALSALSGHPYNADRVTGSTATYFYKWFPNGGRNEHDNP